MSAPFNRTALKRGAAVVRVASTAGAGGVALYTRDDFSSKVAPSFNPVKSSLHGQTDKYKTGLMGKFTIPVFGLYQSLSTLFPSYAMNPTVGTSICGSTDQEVTIHARNTDRIVYPNCWVTKLIDLHLGVDSDLFSAALEFTWLIKKDAMPSDAGAYFVRDTAAYTETAFAMTNFLKGRWSGVWGAKTGFGAIATQKGFRVGWNLDVQTEPVDGYGPMDLFIGEGGLIGNCKCVPIGPTLAQVDTAQNTAADVGALLTADAADLTLSGPSSAAVVLKGAGLIETETVFGIKPLRQGEVAWETTRGFTAGVPSAVATVA